jgi:hypothetical protein
MYMARGTLVSVRDGLHLRPGTMAAYSCDIMNGPRARMRACSLRIVNADKGESEERGMEYFRRYDPDGSCVVICLRCFATVGIAGNVSAALTIENAHECTRRHPIADQKQASPGILSRVAALRGDLSSRFLRSAARLKMPYTALFFLAVFVLLYAFPTVVELVAVRYAVPAMGIILFGDLVGCACLATILRSPFIAGALYVSLTFCELWLHSSGAVRSTLLPWILDLVPTLVVVGKIAWIRAHTQTRSLLA